MIWTIQPRSKSDQGLAYIERPGPGPALLLLHGVGLCAESWAAQIAALEGRVHLVAVDLPGHGESNLLDGMSADLAGYRQALTGFIEEVIGGPVILIGHSLGGLLALELAATRPDLTLGLAALNTVYQRSPDAAKAVKARAQELQRNSAGDIASAPIQRWFGDNPEGDTLEAAVACRSWLMSCNRTGYARAYKVFAGNDGPPEQAISDIGCPALFLTGARDPNSTPAMSARLAELAPQGQCLVFDDAAHMAQMTHPEAVNAALMDLIGACGMAASLRQAGGCA